MFQDSDRRLSLTFKMKVRNVRNKVPSPQFHGIDASRSPKPTPPVKSREKSPACILCGYNENDVSYYKFPYPSDKSRKEWLRICELPESNKSRNLRLCERHFTEDQKWCARDGSVHLKYGIIPKLNLEIYGLNKKESEDSAFSVQQALLSRNCAETEQSFETSSTSHSESSVDVTFENTSNSKNSLNIELVEVVEMKIYRYNSSPREERSESSNSTSRNGLISVNELEDESETQSNIAPHVKGLEMHSYSKPASTEIPSMVYGEPQRMKRVKALRYFGDLQEEDFANPEKAKHCWSVAKRVIDKRNEKILFYEEENEKLARKLKNLREILQELRKTGSIPKKYRKNTQHSKSNVDFSSIPESEIANK